MRLPLLYLVATLIIGFHSPSWSSSSVDESQLQKQLAEFFGIPATAFRITDSELPHYKAFQVENNFGLISNDGQYLIQGTAINTATRESVLASVQRQSNLDILAQLPTSLAIKYPARSTKSQIWVFSDVDCYYCQKLHREMAILNELGISVHYYAFPRSGNPQSSDWRRAERVWCAQNQIQAMDRAKQPASVDKVSQVDSCDPNIQQQYQIGKQLGVRGTPTILLANGEMISGYTPAQALAIEAINANP